MPMPSSPPGGTRASDAASTDGSCRTRSIALGQKVAFAPSFRADIERSMVAISTLTVNRLVRRKLKLSLFLLGIYVVVHVVLAFRVAPNADVDDQRRVAGVMGT